MVNSENGSGADDPDLMYIHSMSLAGSSSITTPGPNADERPLSIDQLVQLVTTNTDMNELSQTLKNVAKKDARDNTLSAFLTGGQDPLSLLDPEQNTLAYLYILSARLHSNATTPSLQSIQDFCSRFNPTHARLAPERITLLAKGIVRAAEASNNLKYALGPLYDLVRRYRPTASHLTTLHPIFVSTCVQTRHFNTALPVLSSPIVEIDLTVSDLHYNDNLVYHYAGGIALGALKKWREAEEFFEICVSAPAQIPAAIQLEALKKLTLVQLILYGKGIAPPKYTHPGIVRMLKNSPYGALTRAYPQPVSQLSVLVTKETDTFNADKNMGLVQQAVERAPRWLIRKLTATYLTLGLSDIAKQAAIENEDDAKAILVNMIEEGEIDASISVDGTVTFSQSAPQFTKADIDRVLRQAQKQSELLHELERGMNVSKEYLMKATRHKDDAGWGGEEDSFNPPSGGNTWTEESMFS